MILDAYASLPHYVDHLLPAWSRVSARGRFWVTSEGLAERVVRGVPDADVAVVRGSRLDRPVLVAGYQDLASVRRRRAPQLAYMEHGTGQSYAGDPRTRRQPAYAGGDGRDGCGLILAPNVFAAARWRERYPRIPVHVIGATRVLTPPEDPRRSLLVVSFHWSGGVIPEMRSAIQHYRGILDQLAERVPVVGHAHPRARIVTSRIFAKAGIPFVDELEDVARIATVYAVDNSSTLWELGRTRPVIALDAPWYRRHVSHGLRFWDLIPGESARDGDDLIRIATRLILDGETDAERETREACVRAVIPYLDGAERAATILAEWLDRL